MEFKKKKIESHRIFVGLIGMLVLLYIVLPSFNIKGMFLIPFVILLFVVVVMLIRKQKNEIRKIRIDNGVIYFYPGVSKVVEENLSELKIVKEGNSEVILFNQLGKQIIRITEDAWDEQLFSLLKENKPQSHLASDRQNRLWRY